MPHQCDMHIETNLMLTLPDTDGWHDRLVIYRCHGCARQTTITGSFNLRSSPFTLADLETKYAAERQEGTTLAKVAQREDALRRRQRAWEGRG